MDVQLSDFVTIGLLVLLEGLLSADNALVLALMILGLPRQDQKKALRYGLVGRVRVPDSGDACWPPTSSASSGSSCSAASTCCIWPTSTSSGAAGRARQGIQPAQPWCGLSALWGTVVKVELVNIAFSVDSILVAVAMSRRLGWSSPAGCSGSSRSAS